MAFFDRIVKHSQLPEPSPESYKRNALFGASTDVADKLPPAAREKLEALRTERDDLHALVYAPSEKARKLSLDAGAVEGRIFELTRTGARPLADNHPQVEAERASLGKLRGEIKRLRAQADARRGASNAAGRLVKAIEDYLADVGSVTLAKPIAAPTLGKHETALTALEKTRKRIEALRAEQQSAVDAPIPSSMAKEIARGFVESLAARGRPDVLRTLEGRRVPGFAENDPSPGTLGRSVDTLAVMAWLHKGALVKALEQAIEEDADDASALTDEARADKIAASKREILALERQEMVLVEMARATGANVQHREDLDVRAALGLADSMPEPRA